VAKDGRLLPTHGADQNQNVGGEVINAVMVHALGLVAEIVAPLVAYDNALASLGQGRDSRLRCEKSDCSTWNRSKRSWKHELRNGTRRKTPSMRPNCGSGKRKPSGRGESLVVDPLNPLSRTSGEGPVQLDRILTRGS
jgi:hypothetical protein